MTRRSSLLARPRWWKLLLHLLDRKANPGYFVDWSRGEISYEDVGRAVVFFSDRLTGTPQRILRRDQAFSIARDGTATPLDGPTWELVSERVGGELTRRKVSWRLE